LELKTFTNQEITNSNIASGSGSGSGNEREREKGLDNI